MGVQDFHRFIRQKCPHVFVPVDLLKVAQAIGIRRQPQNFTANAVWSRQGGALHIVIDGECCLDRLYGGYFNDWSCGGQWNRMLQFLQLLFATMQGSRIYVAVFFDGALQKERFGEYVSCETTKSDKISQILRHIRRRKTPPPKVLWMSPAGLKSALKFALRHLNIPVFQTVDDHKSELMGFLRQHDYDALLVEGAEYLFFDPPKYFSAESLKLTFKGSLETYEIVMNEVALHFSIESNRLPLFAALLGNFIMPQTELISFYNELIADVKLDEEEHLHKLMQALLAFVRNLASIDDLLAIGKFIFRREEDETRKLDKSRKFVRSVQYYMNNTATHFEKFWKHRPPFFHAQTSQHSEQFASDSQNEEHSKTLPNVNVESLKLEMDELSLKNDEQLLTHSPETSPSLEADPDSMKEHFSPKGSPKSDHASVQNSPVLKSEPHLDKSYEMFLDPSIQVVEVPCEVLRVSYERHRKGLMHPWIYQCLSKATIRIDCCLEDGNDDLPFGWFLWRPVRQRVYAVLFNLNHKLFLNDKKLDEQHACPVNDQAKKNDAVCSPAEISSRICMREWVCNQYGKPDLVHAVPLTWRGVPTVQRLWFGKQEADKQKRITAFLHCLSCESAAQLLLDTKHVPQHLLLFSCVLRYLISCQEFHILQRHELDAFLAQAVSPQLVDPNSLQEVQITTLTTRGVNLAQLFMQGVEHALFTNDACGAPIPWLMCCPWLFFDGKLFQIKLDLAVQHRPLIEMCGGQTDQLIQVERLKRAILDGIASPFFSQSVIPTSRHSNTNFPPWCGEMNNQRAMIGRKDLLNRGGQLEVAGVVVGHWGGMGDKSSLLQQPSTKSPRAMMPGFQQQTTLSPQTPSSMHNQRKMRPLAPMALPVHMSQQSPLNAGGGNVFSPMQAASFHRPMSAYPPPQGPGSTAVPHQHMFATGLVTGSPQRHYAPQQQTVMHPAAVAAATAAQHQMNINMMNAAAMQQALAQQQQQHANSTVQGVTMAGYQQQQAYVNRYRMPMINEMKQQSISPRPHHLIGQPQQQVLPQHQHPQLPQPQYSEALLNDPRMLRDTVSSNPYHHHYRANQPINVAQQQQQPLSFPAGYSQMHSSH